MPQKTSKSKSSRTRYIEDSDDETRGRSRNRSIEKSRSRSLDKSQKKSRDKSLTRSRSKSPEKSKSRSKSLTRSRSKSPKKCITGNRKNSKHTKKDNEYTTEESDEESDDESDGETNEESDEELDNKSDGESDEEISEESDEEISEESDEDVPEEEYDDNDIRNIIIENINNEFARGKFGDFNVIIMKDNGFINATKLCKNAGSDFYHWKETKKAKELINELEKYTKLDEKELLILITGGKKYEIRGTYVHPILITNIANWISSIFAMKVGIWIEEWKKYSNNNTLKYYKALSKLKNSGSNNKEKSIQFKLQKKYGGKIEVSTKYGKIDLLTSDKVIEIKSYCNWKHALGQVLAYGDVYFHKRKCICLFDIPDDVNTSVIKKLLDKYDVELLFM
ncbi:kila N-terminal domain N1R/P28 DNA binding protein [Acanthamoeba polyphaga mimivirus]|uniref:Kila N-terminal domain N1R/P28 DNA binding protein n=1 Tax=Acanthamoeba polyphaga mimivirus TaxID=212035 RepID=A0A0G2Y7E1_MIMIV|nr:kila N-terminal domain N1R/P28 DNA binding protein [Acanthamoeba polyphaga mimivirus]AKI79724.1 kila N-terminal domain N1R/P28 DNA binding protein [Acanthamoeba polyphaga mimivirus]